MERAGFHIVPDPYLETELWAEELECCRYFLFPYLARRINKTETSSKVGELIKIKAWLDAVLDIDGPESTIQVIQRDLCFEFVQKIKRWGMKTMKDPRPDLEPLFADLRKIEGVVKVEPDDWNSTAIDVFVTLVERGRTSGGRPLEFQSSVRKVKGQIRSACHRHDVEHNFLQWPTRQYWDDHGRRERDGFDDDYIKVELFH